MNSRFRIVGRLDHASRVQAGTVTISRTSGTFAVRPLRRRKEYVLPLATVAEMVCQRLISRRAARAPRREGETTPVMRYDCKILVMAPRAHDRTADVGASDFGLSPRLAA